MSTNLQHLKAMDADKIRHKTENNLFPPIHQVILSIENIKMLFYYFLF